MRQIVFALGCHPDDIEFMMAGTLFLLQKVGCEIHYMSIANGSCGSAEKCEIEEIVGIRRAEAIKAAKLLGASFHESLTNDLEVFYQQDLIKKMTAIIRDIKPDIMLIPSLEDYMEDHVNTARIAVTAAFSKACGNFSSIPERAAIQKDITLYHALPYGLRNGMKRVIKPEMYIDITGVIKDKRNMLSCHESQKSWIDKSQGIDNYLNTMEDWSKEVGDMSGRFDFAEGWRRHHFLGYSAKEIDPLYDILKAYALKISGRKAHDR